MAIFPIVSPLISNNVSSVLSPYDGFLPTSLPNLALWLDPVDLNTITKAYQNLAQTGSGTSGTTVITANSTVANLVQAGQKIRIGATDIYTVSSVVTTTINTIETLSTNYGGGSILALDRSSQWNDKSGLGNNATQATALSQLIYTPNRINGNSVFVGDGVAFMNIASGIYTIPNSDLTYFALSQLYSAATNQFRYLAIAGTATKRTHLEYSSSADTINFLSNQNNNNTISTPTVVRTNPNIVMGQLSGITQAISLNNGAQNTNALGGYYIGTSATVGASTGGTIPIIGMLGDILIYGRALSIAEISQVFHWYTSKWGVATL